MRIVNNQVLVCLDVSVVSVCGMDGAEATQGSRENDKRGQHGEPVLNIQRSTPVNEVCLN